MYRKNNRSGLAVPIRSVGTVCCLCYSDEFVLIDLWVFLGTAICRRAMELVLM